MQSTNFTLVAMQSWTRRFPYLYLQACRSKVMGAERNALVFHQPKNTMVAHIIALEQKQEQTKKIVKRKYQNPRKPKPLPVDSSRCPPPGVCCAPPPPALPVRPIWQPELDRDRHDLRFVSQSKPQSPIAFAGNAVPLYRIITNISI